MKLLAADDIIDLATTTTLESTDFALTNLSNDVLQETCKSADNQLVITFLTIEPATDIGIFYTNATTYTLVVNYQTALRDDQILSDDIVLSETGYQVTRTGSTDSLPLQWVDKVYQQNRPRSFWAELPTIEGTVATSCTLTLNANSGQKCYLGRVFGGTSIDMPNPQYGADWSRSSHSVSIHKIYGGKYRRWRKGSRIFTGEMWLKPSDNYIETLEQIADYHDDAPLPWLLPNKAGGYLPLYGGITNLRTTLETLSYSRVDIEITGEV